MLAAAGATGVEHKWRETFFGEDFDSQQLRLLFAACLDLVEGHPQVGVHPLLGRIEVAAGIQLVGLDAHLVMPFAAQGNDAGGHREDQQADQQHVQGFMPGAGRAHHLDAAHCSISA
ncbi:hypothetical protein D3C84_873560 [compost metagenome]